MATSVAGPLSPPLPVEQHASYMITPPTSIGGTPADTSPVSPRRPWPIPQHLQAHMRQLRPQKQPMYVPAVLRPTEKPMRQSPPKNISQPNTAYGSPESIDSIGNQLPQSPVLARAQLSRVVTEEWNEDIVGPVTGVPSRNHWKPDSASPTCDYPVCEKLFTFFDRRHHCRRCGGIFCFEHSAHAIPLDQHARFHPQGSRNRACDACFCDYRTWAAAHLSRTNSIASRDSNGSPDPPPTPNVEIAPGQDAETATNPAKGFVSALAQSIPRDWSWSTF